MSNYRNIFLGLTLALGASAGMAQDASAPTATGETGLFTVIDGWTVPHGEWSFGIYYNNWDRLVSPIPGGVARPLTDDWDYDWNRLSASVGYGITDKFELSLMLPYDDFSASDNNHYGVVNGHYFENKIDANGLGNARVGIKYQFFADADAGKALALNAFVEAPTGKDEGVSTDDTGYGVGLNWNFHRNWTARVGYRDPGDPDFFDVSEEIEVGFGYAVAINDRFDWITELASTLYQGGDTNPDDAYDLASGGRYWFGEDRRWAFNFALRTDLNQLSDTDEHCPIGGLVGLTLMPHARRAAPVAVAPPPPPPPVPDPRAEEAARQKAAEEAAASEAARKAAEEAARQAAADAAPKETSEVINFDSNSARLSNIAKAKLDEVALRMKQNPSATALIIGETDSQGADGANMNLGRRRAEAAKSYLVSRHQIDGSRISVETRGESDPVATNDTATGRAENRRAVIIVRL
ncbi:MAG: OmpA family protein [Thermoanaerobaculia bacterium]